MRWEGALGDMESWTDFITSEFQSTDDFGSRGLMIFGLVAAIWILRWLILRVVLNRMTDVSSAYWFTKISSYVATALSLFVVGQALLGGFASLLTFLGLLAAGLAIALQEPITNMFAWLFIVWRRPYELGHRVQIGDAVGDVVDIRLFQTSLLEIREWVGSDQPTGRIIHIPNSRVFTETQYNYSLGIPFIWDEVPVLVTFESDWQKAKRLLLEIVNRSVPEQNRVTQNDIRIVSRRYRVSSDLDTEPAVYTSVLDSGVLLTLRYTVRPFERRKYAEDVWESILIEFAKHPDIDFAYPTTRFYNNLREGPMAMQQAQERRG